MREDRGTRTTSGGTMAKIVHSVEIARSPGPMKVGSRAKMTRLAGGRERTMTSELTEYDPARSYTFRGIDGPMKAIDASAGRKFPLRRRRSADTVAWEYGELTLTILALAGGGTRCQALHSGTFVHLGRPSKE